MVQALRGLRVAADVRHSRAVKVRAVMAVLMLLMAATVHGVTIEYLTVGDPGNPASSTGWGAVAQTFQISAYETTNAHYAEFLNTIGQFNPNGVYDARMASDLNGGILQTGSPGSYSYVVKPGTGPNGQPYAAMPVTFVSWYSAARFVNWLQNGQPATPGSLEQGTYQLDNKVSGPPPSRTAGSGLQVVLPSRDEWYKAAFFRPVSQDYSLYPCQTSGPAPCPANVGGAEAATFGPLPVGTFPSSVSAFGVFDMLGNVIEYTDTPRLPAQPGFGDVQVVGAAWSTPLQDLGSWSSLAEPIVSPTTLESSGYGFRVAVVQAVPEPAAWSLLATAAVMGAFRRRTATGAGPTQPDWLSQTSPPES